MKLFGKNKAKMEVLSKAAEPCPGSVVRQGWAFILKRNHSEVRIMHPRGSYQTNLSMAVFGVTVDIDVMVFGELGHGTIQPTFGRLALQTMCSACSMPVALDGENSNGVCQTNAGAPRIFMELSSGSSLPPNLEPTLSAFFEGAFRAAGVNSLVAALLTAYAAPLFLEHIVSTLAKINRGDEELFQKEWVSLANPILDANGEAAELLELAFAGVAQRGR